MTWSPSHRQALNSRSPWRWPICWTKNSEFLLPPPPTILFLQVSRRLQFELVASSLHQFLKGWLLSSEFMSCFWRACVSQAILLPWWDVSWKSFCTSIRRHFYFFHSFLDLSSFCMACWSHKSCLISSPGWLSLTKHDCRPWWQLVSSSATCHGENTKNNNGYVLAVRAHHGEKTTTTKFCSCATHTTVDFASLYHSI